ncbi:MAG: hypothetical protein ASARMPREDX12_009011 [Alectoria sarmentosa]|nr:MAG: hypothetical protein ASARMPREDX12_009011 [Alectoria sarmentosa]
MDTLAPVERHVRFDEDDTSKAKVLSRALPLGSIRGGDEQSTCDVQTKERKYTVWGGLRATIFSSWIMMFLISAVPAGFAVKYTDQSPVITFAVNFVAIIPLGHILDAVTEELVIRRGGHEGMLIVITFGNVVQLVITIIALIKHQTSIVQTSLIGAVISNSVLMVGIGFFFGGINRLEQNFNPSTVGSSLNELALSVAALILPTAMNTFSTLRPNERLMAEFSRGEAILLLLSYICFCHYCYKTHSAMFTEPHQRAELRKVKAHHGDAEKGIAQIGASLAASAGGATGENVLMRRAQEIPLPKMSQPALASTLIIVTTFLGFNTTFAVDSIDGLTQRTVLTQNFVGLVLLPLLGCNPHSVILAAKDEMPTSFAISISSSIQLLLGILPLAVIIGWIRHDDSMTLLFNGFQVVSLAVSILVLKYMTDDGKSNWLDGVVLIALYAIIALNAWITPDPVLGRG